MIKNLFLKFLIYIRMFFTYFSIGMKNANDLAFTGNNDVDAGNGMSIEQQKEVNSVYKDLLRGEITQEVIELRHRMYFAERRAKKYQYDPNSDKLKEINNSNNIDKTDGLNIVLSQNNKIIYKGVTEELENNKKKYRINITRDFTTTFPLEKYATKIIVKKLDENTSILDIYVSKYKYQFDNVHKLFIKQVEKIYNGDAINNNIINFKKLDFITYNALGIDDLYKFEFDNIRFKSITEYKDSYILKFTANNLIFGEDQIAEFYDQNTEDKSNNKEQRSNTIIEDIFTKYTKEI